MPSPSTGQRVPALRALIGVVENLINHPVIMTHPSVLAERRAALGITDKLVWTTVGVENVTDMRAELESALR